MSTTKNRVLAAVPRWASYWGQAKSIADDAGCSEPTARKYLRQLAASDAVRIKVYRVHKDGGARHYQRTVFQKVRSV